MKTDHVPRSRPRTIDRSALSWADLLRAAVRDPGRILAVRRASRVQLGPFFRLGIWKR